MKTNYTLTARNGGNNGLITFETSGNIHWIMEMVKVAEKAFRDIVVVCDDTGEVMLNTYKSEDLFTAQISEPFALMQLQVMVSEMRKRQK